MNSRVDKSRAALARDAAILRVGRTRRWVIAGAAALTAGFAALVSAVAPGKSLASKSHSAARTTTGARSASAASSAIPQFPPAANPSSLGLQSPNEPPQSAQSPPQSTTPAPESTTPAPQSTTPAPQSTTPAPAPSAPAPQPVTPQPVPQSGGS